jgi:hypothetical protein
MGEESDHNTAATMMAKLAIRACFSVRTLGRADQNNVPAFSVPSGARFCAIGYHNRRESGGYGIIGGGF